MRRISLSILSLVLAIPGCSTPIDGIDADGDAGPVPGPAAWRVAWRAPLHAEAPAYASPLLVDVDANGVLDVVLGNGQGIADAGETLSPGGLAAYSGVHGIILWVAPVGPVDASAVIGDVTGDGKPEIGVGTREGRAAILVDVATGALVTSRPMTNWVHSPALVDVDASGVLDAVFVTGGDDSPRGGSGKPGELLALAGGDLAPLWRVALAEEAYSSPAVARAGDRLLLVHGLGGQLHAGGGLEAREAATGALAWREAMPTGVLASPAVADFDGDGALDVAAATWWGDVFARRAADGKPLWNASTRELTWTSPAVADLDGDGRPEVVVSSYRTEDLHFREFEQQVNGKHSLASGTAGSITAFDGPTGRAAWRRVVDGTPGTPIVADATGDGRAEVIVAVANGSRGYYGEGGRLLALDSATGKTVAELPLPGAAIATPAAGDLDGDGRAEIVIATVRPAELLAIGLDAPLDAPWPRFRGNERGTGEPSPEL